MQRPTSKNIYILDRTHKAYFLYTSDGNKFGLVVQHQCLEGSVEELLPFREGGYKLIDDDPLTLDLHIICDDCGDYGTITDGDWAPYKETE